jgi:hypothetical protein
VQPDGRDICELPTCPQGLPPEDGSAAAPSTADCAPPPPDPIPMPAPLPAPTPAEVVLVDAEHSLVALPANDGTGDTYLVPGYRFTTEDGGTVDLPAVADSALAGPAPTQTTVPDAVVRAPVPLPAPVPCEVLEEQDPGTETTHTMQTCPTPKEEPRVLSDDEEPAIGVGYYVDVHVEHCPYVEFAGWFWSFVADGTADPVADGWAMPTEGGTFTLESDTDATFVGDAAGTKVGHFHRESQEGLTCA